MTSEHRKIRVATLNTLHNPKLLSGRGKLIVDELHEIQPDIICFQEVMKETPFNLPAFVQKELGFKGFVQGDSVPTKYQGVTSGNVIISRNFVDTVRSLGTVTSNPKEVPSVAISTTIDGQRVEVINSHFAWGGDSESQRQQQALMVDRYARRAREAKPGCMVVLAGDLNATPDADVIRFLDGSTTLGLTSTLWADAFDNAGNPDESCTVRNDNEFAKSTAMSVGIQFPEMMPERRIDYIKSYGFSYGRTGSPLLCKRWADSTDETGLTISDHYGLYADFLLA
jgi:endonuclease/exonuclease/phosphatase family metal-dependent hydrolase